MIENCCETIPGSLHRGRAIDVECCIPIGCDNRETILMIEKPTEVHCLTHASSSQDPNANVQLGKVIASLKAGERVHASGIYHGQGVDGFQVKLADETEGLIIGRNTFKVISC